MSEWDAGSYDELHYPSYVHPQTHPRRLAAVARLMGHTPPDVDRCRVLEIGCSNGSNLLPMAAALPGSTFVGIDLAATRIAEGAARAAACGLKNVELKAESLTTVGSSLGDFDYIVVHGVYSWVPEEIREATLALISQRLTPNGVAFVSFNVFPGWASRMLAGGIMRYFTRGEPRPGARAALAKRVLGELTALERGGDAFWEAGLKVERDRLDRSPDAYLFHEYFGGDHRIFYFHEVAAAAARHGLTWMGEAGGLGGLCLGAVKAPDPALFPGFGIDGVETQQYLDFATNRFFRQSLFTRADRPRWVEPRPDALASTWVAAAARAERGGLDPRGAEPAAFQVEGRRVSEGRPLMKAALLVLGAAWPASTGVEDLLERSRARLGVTASDNADRDRRALHTWLFQGILEGWVHLDPSPVRAVRTPGPFPVASPLVRLQATEGEVVVNLRHEELTLDPLSRQILPLLDATRDRDQLEALVGPLPASGPLGRALSPGRAGLEDLLGIFGEMALLLA